MTSTDDRIERLQTRIDQLEEQQRILREKLTQAQVEQWQGRIEDLELQAHLATMDAGDRVQSLRDELLRQWQDVRNQLAHSKDTAGDVVETVRDGIETALRNLREALLEARAKTRA